MLRLLNRPGAAMAALAVVAMLFVAAPARAEWGTIKGTVVWGGGAVPANPPANVNKDQRVCLAKGPILTNEIVVNKKNLGVRWVLVWLADPKDHKNVAFTPPIHPSLKKFKETVEIDQPCCVFEPRVIGLREGQTLTVKNPAPVAHNFSINSINGGPVKNPLIPPGGQDVVKGFVPKYLPTPYSCSIHAWMKGYIGVFAHPYFAITDENGNFEIKNAPAGKFRLVLWQEKSGWVVMKNPRDVGKIIEVKDKETTDLGKIKLTISDD